MRVILERCKRETLRDPAIVERNSVTGLLRYSASYHRPGRGTTVASVTPKNSDARTRQVIAGVNVAAGIVGILVASCLAIALSNDADRSEMIRLVFASVLPLIGTWVGTVLAFYFARENLQAATDSTVRLAGLAAPTTPVSDVMIPTAQIVAHELKAGQEARTVKLAELENEMSEAKVRVFQF